MKDLMTVAEFTLKDMLQRKSFIISMIIILILIVVGFNIQNIMNAFKGEDTSETAILVVDSQNIYEGVLPALNNLGLGCEFNISNEDLSIDEIKQKLENSDIDYCIRLSKNENVISFEYITTSMSMFSIPPETFILTFGNLYKDVQISKSGLTEEQMEIIYSNIEFVIETTETDENAAKRKCTYYNAVINSIILCDIFLCISSIKLNNNRKNIKNY